VDVLSAVTNIPYPSWLNSADNTWQLVAATLVGLMSLPGLAVLYGGLVRKKWIVNTMLMVFAGFSITLIVWMLWGYNMAFGPISHFGCDGIVLERVHWSLHPVGDRQFGAGPSGLGGQYAGALPLPDGDPGVLPVRVRRDHAAAVLGRLVGRLKFKAWLFIVPLWITMVYCVNAACSGVAASSPRRVPLTTRADTSST
jgi:Amt family ammonium transporter